MSLKLLGGLLTLTLECWLCNSGCGPGGFAVSAQTVRQHGGTDHAGVNLQSAPAGEPSTEGCAQHSHCAHR